MLFGVPGTLGNRLKTLKGIRFSHFGILFAGTNSKLDREGDFSWIFKIFETFGTSFGDCFGTKK